MADGHDLPSSPEDSDDERAGSAGGSGGIPGLEELLRMLGVTPGPGGAPDLASMVRELFGPDAQLPPELTHLFAAMQADPASSPLASIVHRQLDAFFGDHSPSARMASSTDLARKVAATGGDRSVTDGERHDIEQAVAVARLWLDPVTTLDSPAGPARAWSAAEWVQASMPRWYAVIEPVSEGVAAAGAQALRRQLGQLGGAGGLGDLGVPGGQSFGGVDFGQVAGSIGPMLQRMAAGMFAAQIGQAVGALAGDVLSGTEAGLPLVDTGTVALLPAAVAAFAAGLALDPAEVRLHLAVREAARVRLFGEVPWLAAQLEAAVRDYGHHVSIDTDAIEQAVRSVDPQDLASMQHAFSQAQLFGSRPTAEQQAALTRLEATLALVEGWVDLVTEQATAAHLPHTAALAEAVRRRRAGGPAQKAFASLVGLELRPRRMREARTLWAALESAGGVALRDGSWAYPDLAPTAADLDDPLGYVERRLHPPAPDALDAELAQLLSDSDDADGPDRPPTGPGTDQP